MLPSTQPVQVAAYTCVTVIRYN